MCDVLDRVELKGRQEGRREGEMKKAREMACSLFDMGVSVEKIAAAARVSIDVVKQWVVPSGNGAK